LERSGRLASALTTPPVQLRPNVLAHPSPTTGRFLLLIATLLSVGLLAGNLIHNVVLAGPWTTALRTCFAVADAAMPSLSSPADLAAHNGLVVDCLASSDWTRALFSVGGAGIVLVLGLAVVALVPSLLRRRYRLRPAGPSLAGAVHRIGELASMAGLRRPPRLLLGRAAQRDAFVFGLPGRYNVVLPTALAVRWRQDSVFAPVVRHELAHIRRRDVPFAWLATGVWIAAIPVLAAPVVVSATVGDFSLTWAYLWRALVVMAVLWLVRQQALRSREHDADLHAARQAGDWRPLCSVLEMNNKTPNWWQQVRSHHPTVALRLQVLADPGRIRGVSVVDGLAAGFLTALALPLIQTVVEVAASGSPLFSWSMAIAAAIVGPVAGLAVGVGLWRQAMIDRVTGARTWPGGAVFGVVAGLLIGEAISLDDLGLVQAAGTEVPVTILVGAAAVLLSAATGQLWADAAARLPGGPRSWWIGFVVNALIFALSLWAIRWVPVMVTAANLGGLGVSDLAVSLGRLAGTALYVAAIPLIVAAAAMVWRRRHLPTPPWLVDGPPPASSTSTRDPSLLSAVLAGAIPGLIGAVFVHLDRLALGSPTTDDERIDRYLFWLTMGTAVALTVSFITVAAIPRSGAAIGLLTGVVAASVAALGALAANTFLIGNIFDLSFWWNTIVTMDTLWLAGYLLLLPLTLAVWPARWRSVPGWLLGTVTTLASAVVAFCGLVLSVAAP
jgi:Zn-dependent protease with chaperone function